jgi:V/A-type H+/Na+-transporting ATPase subunit F
MVNATVLGRNEFIVGFQLAGIKDIMEVSGNPLDDILELRKRKDVGIVIVDEHVLESIDHDRRIEIEDSVDPVFIPVSAKAEQDSLRRLIKKSIGVDLWS